MCFLHVFLTCDFMCVFMCVFYVCFYVCFSCVFKVVSAFFQSAGLQLHMKQMENICFVFIP